jgi:hypothetical protein
VSSRVLYQRLNGATRTRTVIERDAQTGVPLIRQVQDTRPILDQNQRDASAFDRARVARNPGGFRHIARIPLVVLAQLRQLGIVEGMTVVDEKRFLQFLSDSQVRKLRTDDGARLA